MGEVRVWCWMVDRGIPLLDSLIAAELETVNALKWVWPATLDIAATGLEALMKKDIMICVCGVVVCVLEEEVFFEVVCWVWVSIGILVCVWYEEEFVPNGCEIFKGAQLIRSPH